MENKREMYRQGDVILLETSQDMTGATVHDSLCLAEGEETGHHHTIYSPQPGAIKELIIGDRRFVSLDVEALLKHQEHNCFSIVPATYEIRIEREFDYIENELKRVVD